MWRYLIWLLMAAAVPGHAADVVTPSKNHCCDLRLPPTDPLLDGRPPAADPGRELPAPEPAFVADLHHQGTPSEPPRHPRARGGEDLCAAAPDTGLGYWYKEGIAYDDHTVAEPIRGRRVYLPYSCY